MPFVESTGEPYVIAELGMNHNGNLNTAKKLIKSVNQAGADCAKLQLYRTNYLLSPIHTDDEIIKVFRKHEISKDNYRECKKLADTLEIDIAASVFDPELLDWYARETDPPFIKIASPDITFKRLLESASTYDVPVVLSTGGATLNEIKRALSWLNGESNDVSIMHCIPSYPAPNHSLHLNCIPMLQESFGIPVGFSDHSQSHTAPLLAHHAGADLWERHVTLDSSQQGPEHEFSLEMENFEEIIQQFKTVTDRTPEEIGAEAENMMGKNELPQTKEIREFRKNARRSLMADRPLTAGSPLQEGMIRELRPGTGLPAEKIDDCIGLPIQRPTDPGEMISY